MRRTVLIVPGLLSSTEGESYLRQGAVGMCRLTEQGDLSKVTRLPRIETPEAMLLGMNPRTVSLHQGPLTVSALGWDPPERSTHFHLSLMSLQEGRLIVPDVLPLPSEVDHILEQAKRLNTKTLTVLQGEMFDHALVWESVGDIGMTSASDVDGHLMKDHLPEGDGESSFRRFVDDSINMIAELELNERRVDQGLPPFNVLWPWGGGVRTSVPNLALRRGEPAKVESASMRLAGLTRLAGYKHGSREALGKGLATKLRNLADRLLEAPVAIAYLDVAQNLRRDNREEELAWFIRELDGQLIQPLLDDHNRTPSRLTIIAPGCLTQSETMNLKPSEIGLAVISETGQLENTRYPFDERSLDEKAISTRDLWTLVESGL